MKYILLIIVIFIIIVFSFTGSCSVQEGFDVHCGCYPGFVIATGGCGSIGEFCCRQPNGHIPLPLCEHPKIKSSPPPPALPPPPPPPPAPPLPPPPTLPSWNSCMN